MPDAVEPLVEYFRCISGEHPDWDEYREAMRAAEQVADPDHRRAVGPGRDRRLPARRRPSRHRPQQRPRPGRGRRAPRRRERSSVSSADALPGVDVRRVEVPRRRAPAPAPRRPRRRSASSSSRSRPAVEVGVAQRPAAVLRGPAEPLGDVEDPAVGRVRSPSAASSRCRAPRDVPASRVVSSAVPTQAPAAPGREHRRQPPGGADAAGRDHRHLDPVQHRLQQRQRAHRRRGRARRPRAPRATTRSAPARSARTASATVPACTATRTPASRSRSTYGSTPPKLTETSAGRRSVQVEHRVELRGVPLQRPGHQPDAVRRRRGRRRSGLLADPGGGAGRAHADHAEPAGGGDGGGERALAGTGHRGATTGTERSKVSVSQVCDHASHDGPA